MNKVSKWKLMEVLALLAASQPALSKSISQMRKLEAVWLSDLCVIQLESSRAVIWMRTSCSRTHKPPWSSVHDSRTPQGSVCLQSHLPPAQISPIAGYNLGCFSEAVYEVHPEGRPVTLKSSPATPPGMVCGISKPHHGPAHALLCRPLSVPVKIGLPCCMCCLDIHMLSDQNSRVSWGPSCIQGEYKMRLKEQRPAWDPPTHTYAHT